MTDPLDLVDAYAAEHRFYLPLSTLSPEGPRGPSKNREDVAPAAFSALRAVLELHAEPEDTELRHGHWEGHGPNERWIREEPNECPQCGSPEPCPTVQTIISALEAS